MKTIRGDRPLRHAFWLAFILPGLCINMVDRTFAAMADLGQLDRAIYLGILVLVMAAEVLVVYGFGLGTIRSALKRQPRDLWSILAIIVVVLVMTFEALVLYFVHANTLFGLNLR